MTEGHIRLNPAAKLEAIHLRHHHVTDGKTYLKVAVDGGYLRLKEIQLTGKKRMRIEDFLRGFRMPENLLML